MKKKKDFMKDRVVRVPVDLTVDPNYKRGWMGFIVSSDYKEGIIQVGFDDGTSGNYDFNCLEILHSTKTLLYHFNAKIRELSPGEILLVRSIIKLASVGEHEAAFQKALLSEKTKELCITDTGTFYNIKRSIKKHLGIGR